MTRVFLIKDSGMLEKFWSYTKLPVTVVATVALTLAAYRWVIWEPVPVPPPPLPEPTIEVPVVIHPQYVVEKGVLASIEVKSLNTIVWWLPPNTTDKIQFRKMDKELLFVARAEGVYYIGVNTSVKDKPSEPVFCKIVVGKEPTPPGPDPDPDPPVPDTPLVKSLKQAWLLESETDKKHLPKLIDIYSQAATMVNDSRLTTYKQINDAIKSVRQLNIGESLPNLRNVINSEFNKVLPTNVNLALDGAGRKLCADTFSLIASSLKNIK